MKIYNKKGIKDAAIYTFVIMFGMFLFLFFFGTGVTKGHGGGQRSIPWTFEEAIIGTIFGFPYYIFIFIFLFVIFKGFHKVNYKREIENKNIKEKE